MKIILSFLSLFYISIPFAQDVKPQQDSIGSTKKAEEVKEVTVFGNKKQFPKVEQENTNINNKEKVKQGGGIIK